MISPSTCRVGKGARPAQGKIGWHKKIITWAGTMGHVWAVNFMAHIVSCQPGLALAWHSMAHDMAQ